MRGKGKSMYYNGSNEYLIVVKDIYYKTPVLCLTAFFKYQFKCAVLLITMRLTRYARKMDIQKALIRMISKDSPS